MPPYTDQSIIVSAWPCAGKTYFTKLKVKEEHPPIDLDSCAYDLKSSAGTQKYVEDIVAKAKSSLNSVILVSSHAEVRQLLRDNGLKYVAVSIDDLEDWKKRQMKRVDGEPDNENAHRCLLNKGIAEWDIWKAREAGEEGPRIVLGRGQYLADVDQDEIRELLKR